MSERWGMWLILLRGNGVNQWLRSYDLEAHDGLGDVVSTTDPAKALVFPDAAAVLHAWKQVSTTRPRRNDGRPNRPLSAFTVMPKKLP